MRRTFALLAVSIGTALLEGCTPSIAVKYPSVDAELSYGIPPRPGPRTFAVVDARLPNDRPMHVGSFEVEVEGQKDELTWLAESLERVLQEEGIDVKRVAGPDADVVLNVRRFRIRNRSDGPYHTFTTFRADLLSGGRSFAVTAWFKASYSASPSGTTDPYSLLTLFGTMDAMIEDYVPVERDCYRVPMMAIALEVAAKMNRHVFGQIAPPEEIARLLSAVPDVSSRPDDIGFLNVLRLGATNDRSVVPEIVKLTNRRQGILRASAISALGILGATDQFDLLRKFVAEDAGVSGLTAIKAIGDLDTRESRAFLDGVKKTPRYESEMVREIVTLYD
jgi:hypothetical protein